MSEMSTQDFIRRFVQGTLGRRTRCGRWWVASLGGKMEALRYTPEDYPDDYEDLAYRLDDGSVLSNANVLKYVGRRITWGYKRDPRGQSEEQRWMEAAGAVPLPFTLLTEAGMDIGGFSWIVKPTAENVRMKNPRYYQGSKGVPEFEDRHFTGGCIFAIGDNTYLFDVDRQELTENKIFNPFLVKLPRRAKSIAEAYDMLVPEEVKRAIDAGKQVRRQGEFFFIRQDKDPAITVLDEEEKHILKFVPSRYGFGLTLTRDAFHDTEPLPTHADGFGRVRAPAFDPHNPVHSEFQGAAVLYKTVAEKAENIQPKPGSIGKGNSRSHTVEKFVKVGNDTFVSGKISQQQRQHGDHMLEGWWKVVPNTAVFSWTITGNID
jgi:hypothetical protein